MSRREEAKEFNRARIRAAAEEIIRPGKNIPRSIMITLGVSTAIYVFVVGVMMGTVHHTELAQSDIPFIFTAERLFGGWGRWAGITREDVARPTETAGPL